MAAPTPTLRWQWTSFGGLSPVELYAVLSLRQSVFVVEQSCPYLDADGRDFDAWHLLGWHEHDLVAYLRAFPVGGIYPADAALGRVLTAEPVRGTGLGRPLVLEGVRRVTETFGASPVRLSAQAHLRALYESVGFEVCGDGYDEDGIPHLPMRRR